MNLPTRLIPRLRLRHAASLLAWGFLAILAGADDPNSVLSDPMLSALKTDGKTVNGRLRLIEGNTSLTLAVDDKEKLEKIPLSELVKLVRDGSTPPLSSEGGIILFPDGDRLNRAVIGPAGDASIEVLSLALGTMSVPLDSVLALVLAPPLETDAIYALNTKIREESRTTEVLWLANGDKLTGGLLGIDEKKIAFQPAAGKVDIDRSGVIALAFDPKSVNYPAPKEPYLEVTCVDGSKLGVTQPHMEGGNIVAQTRFGQTVKIPLGELAQIHTKNGSVAYLSDRAVTASKYVSYLGPTRPARMNQAIDGQPLRLAGRVYDRGIGTQSRTYLAYRLEPGVTKFQAIVGIDDRAGPLASVEFRVLVDGKEKYTSKPMSVNDAPKNINVDITGAKNLILFTDFGERGEVRDHANWAEARLIK